MTPSAPRGAPGDGSERTDGTRRPVVSLARSTQSGAQTSAGRQGPGARPNQVAAFHPAATAKRHTATIHAVSASATTPSSGAAHGPFCSRPNRLGRFGSSVYYSDSFGVSAYSLPSRSTVPARVRVVCLRSASCIDISTYSIPGTYSNSYIHDEENLRRMVDTTVVRVFQLITWMEANGAKQERARG